MNDKCHFCDEVAWERIILLNGEDLNLCLKHHAMLEPDSKEDYDEFN